MACVSMDGANGVVPLLQVHLIQGRSPEVKAELVRGLTEVVERTLGSDPQRIAVLVTEYAEGHWNVGGEALELGQVVADD